MAVIPPILVRRTDRAPVGHLLLFSLVRRPHLYSHPLPSHHHADVRTIPREEPLNKRPPRFAWTTWKFQDREREDSLHRLVTTGRQQPVYWVHGCHGFITAHMIIAMARVAPTQGNHLPLHSLTFCLRCSRLNHLASRRFHSCNDIFLTLLPP